MCKVRLTTLCDTALQYLQDTALKYLQTVLAKQKNVCYNIFTSISLNLFLGDCCLKKNNTLEIVL